MQSGVTLTPQPEAVTAQQFWRSLLGEARNLKLVARNSDLLQGNQCPGVIE